LTWPRKVGVVFGQAPVLGDAAIKSVDVVARSGFQQPLDAAPRADGSTVHFTAKAGNAPAVFSVPAAGGAVVKLASGAPLVGQVGVAASGDGTHVFLADPGASRIFAVPSSGGPPVAVAGSDGWAPRGLDVVTGSGGDTIYFSGRDPTDKAPGVFTLPAGGGTPAVVAKGAAFTSPDAVVVAATGGAVYVSDRGNGSAGTVLRVSSTVSTVLDSVRLGDPGGLSLSKDGRALLVSSLDPVSGADQVLFVDLASGKTGMAKNVIGANHNSSGGLHRARGATGMAWADTQGTVYRVRYPCRRAGSRSEPDPC